MSAEAIFKRVVRALDRYGILLETDPRLPSVATIVAGAPIAGSWWGHPKGHEMFRVSQRLAEQPDVAGAKLVSGKATWIARPLWPALVSIGLSREAWQMEGLSAVARHLLDRVTAAGELRTDLIDREADLGGKSIGDGVRELEWKLLIHSESVHTEAGSHAKRLRTWDGWAGAVRFKGERIGVQDAKHRFEEILDGLNLEFSARGRLPWR